MQFLYLAILPDAVKDYLELVNSADFIKMVDDDRVELNARDISIGNSYWDSGFRPYNVSNGDLVVPVQGKLTDTLEGTYRYGSFAATGYPYIRKTVLRGMEDHQVQRIVLDVNSPGGELYGMHRTIDVIRAARSSKQVLADIGAQGASGAYGLAAAAQQIHAREDSRVGSIGVLSVHVEVSRMLEKDGIKVNLIYAGKHKVDYSPYKPLSKEAKNNLQSEVDKGYDGFVSSVARNRRKLTEDDVRATEARVYKGSEAKELGLVDKIVKDREIYTKENGMPNSQVQGNDDQENKITQADVDAAKAEGRAEGITAERKRFSATLGLKEYQGREKLALNLLETTDMTVEKIEATLKTAPKDTAENDDKKSSKNENPFQEAMNGAGTPGVEAEDKEDKNNTLASTVDGIFASAGFKPVNKN